MFNSYKKMLIISFVFIGLLLLTGCDIDKKKYNVTIIEQNYVFQDEVLEKYITYGSFNEQTQEYVFDKKIPEDYTLVIRSNEELEQLFKSFPSVDFTKEMIIVYFYTGIYGSEKKIKDVDFDEGELSIDFSHKLTSGTGSASMPKQRVLIIKMNIVNAYEIDIEED